MSYNITGSSMMPNYKSETGDSTNAVHQSAGTFMKGMSNARGSANAFGMGFQMGYTGVMATTGPMLAFQSAKYEKAMQKSKAELARWQAKTYSTAADDVMRAGERQAASIGMQAGAAKSSARATMAASGIRVGAAGTSAEILVSQDIAKEMNVNAALASAVASAWGYRRQAVSAQNEALAYELSAKQISPFMAAVTKMATDAAEAMDSGQMDDLMSLGKGSKGGSLPSNAKSTGAFSSSASLNSSSFAGAMSA